jgi:hypothetical protein
VLIPLSLVIQMAPISINGFGVREAIFTTFFIRFGIGDKPAAVALSLLGTGVIMAVSLVGGLLFVRRRPASRVAEAPLP